jgi:hypothetical protein
MINNNCKGEQTSKFRQDFMVKAILLYLRDLSLASSPALNPYIVLPLHALAGNLISLLRSFIIEDACIVAPNPL